MNVVGGTPTDQLGERLGLQLLGVPVKGLLQGFVLACDAFRVHILEVVFPQMILCRSVARVRQCRTHGEQHGTGTASSGRLNLRISGRLNLRPMLHRDQCN